MAVPSQSNPSLSPVRSSPMLRRQFPGVREAISGGGLSLSALHAYGVVRAQAQASARPSPQRG